MENRSESIRAYIDEISTLQMQETIRQQTSSNLANEIGFNKYECARMTSIAGGFEAILEKKQMETVTTNNIIRIVFKELISFSMLSTHFKISKRSWRKYK